MKIRNLQLSRWFAPLLFLLVLGGDLSVALGQAKMRSAAKDPAALAQDVTIYRDTYGVPHVFGRTDASTMFGFAYAQAEDNFWRVEQNFIYSLGRRAEVVGESGLNEDRRNRALEIPRLAKEEYERLDPQMRLLCDSFTAGFNYYLTKPCDPQVLITLIETARRK